MFSFGFLVMLATMHFERKFLNLFGERENEKDRQYLGAARKALGMETADNLMAPYPPSS